VRPDRGVTSTFRCQRSKRVRRPCLYCGQPAEWEFVTLVDGPQRDVCPECGENPTVRAGDRNWVCEACFRALERSAGLR
jgi:hypothetical protein